MYKTKHIPFFSSKFANIAQETSELETSLIFFQSRCWDRYLSIWYRPIISNIAIPVPLRIGFIAWKTLQKAKKKSHFLQCKWIAIELPPQHLRWTHIFPPPPQSLRTEVSLWGLNFGNEILQAHYRGDFVSWVCWWGASECVSRKMCENPKPFPSRVEAITLILKLKHVAGRMRKNLHISACT